MRLPASRTLLVASQRLTIAACLLSGCLTAAMAVAAEPPRFEVPGFEPQMLSLEAMYDLHRSKAFTDCTLWDAWLPHATMWSDPAAAERYREVFLKRRMDSEGYVSMQQHRGMAHSQGWPFPAWQQSGGAGWLFSVAEDPWAVQNFQSVPLTSLDGWQIEAAYAAGFDPNHGLLLDCTADEVVLTTPEVHVDAAVAPFLRIELACDPPQESASVRVAWQSAGESNWDPAKIVMHPVSGGLGSMRQVDVPLYRADSLAGEIQRFRVAIDSPAGGRLQVRSIITAIDTRHPITNPLFVRGSCEYFSWTGDIDFLKQNIGRMREAVRFAVDEFDVAQQHHALVRWPGHDGISGLAFDNEGNKVLRPGHGVGNNYWDLLPFGGHDALATMYLYDALRRQAAVERAIASNAAWEIPPPERFDAASLDRLADEVRDDFQETFWEPDAGRFVGWIDAEGTRHDYGFTFVNLEAIHYGLASDAQARAIFDWLDGRRTVAEDTSVGPDIYAWRFGPRSTTRRNVRDYVWVWSNPESIPWGGQVQDGGAVLGFSYFDLMARLKTAGPDDAWRRLQDIAGWFDEVQAAGGYREYYRDGPGTLQGCGTPGGLGLDCEFFESVLVPQVVLYGFLGFAPTADGFEIRPLLPSEWPQFTVRGIHIHGQKIDITAGRDGKILLVPAAPTTRRLVVITGGGVTAIEAGQVEGVSIGP